MKEQEKKTESLEDSPLNKELKKFRGYLGYSIIVNMMIIISIIGAVIFEIFDRPRRKDRKELEGWPMLPALHEFYNIIF